MTDLYMPCLFSVRLHKLILAIVIKKAYNPLDQNATFDKTEFVLKPMTKETEKLVEMVKQDCY